MNKKQEKNSEPLQSQALTWAVLLAQWVDLARSASALGPDQQSQALRKLVPDIIMLQAVWYALTDIHKLELTEMKLGCLRAQWLLDRHEQRIRQAWPAGTLHPMLEDLLKEAHEALAGACRHIHDHETAFGLKHSSQDCDAK